MMAPPNNIVIFHYPYSPYARRVTWYLTLRGLEYAQCIQPPVIPREDLSALGVNYRRIPVMSIGRDIYCDTRLILRKLEDMFPSGALGSKKDDERAIERLLETWTVEAPVFSRAASLIPTTLPAMNDPKFTKDREGFSGRPWSKEVLERGRPESIAYIRNCFDLLETTLLADGRDWILKTDKPSLADIEAIWPFDWLVEMKGSMPANVISAKQFPKVYAWIQRFRAALKVAKSTGPKPVSLKGPEAVKLIITAEFAEPNGTVDVNDPLNLKEGMEVEVYPTDSGFTHRDRGRLVTLTPNEVTVATRSRVGDKEVHIHAPRSGFRITKAGGESVAGSKL
ncbi:glutathione S-transferase [Lepidopterella palustris CBS 459.81]|uniref:Glutathione S-transferase n=1 Tax=Lepidopterella palustris CBS 459.81 TaxID=1314670 RepID=A0A8E2JED2_9PEZI|nr:glutathione S-transferase [Lepidopterella palustris CBS 459.81]